MHKMFLNKYVIEKQCPNETKSSRDIFNRKFTIKVAMSHCTLEWYLMKRDLLVKYACQILYKVSIMVQE